MVEDSVRCRCRGYVDLTERGYCVTCRHTYAEHDIGGVCLMARTIAVDHPALVELVEATADPGLWPRGVPNRLRAALAAARDAGIDTGGAK